MKYSEAMDELLTRQYEAARVDEARQGSLMQIVDPAVAPDRPGSHYRLWIFIGGLVLAFPVALLTAWVADLVSAARRLRRVMVAGQRCSNTAWGAPDEYAAQACRHLAASSPPRRLLVGGV